MDIILYSNRMVEYLKHDSVVDYDNKAIIELADTLFKMEYRKCGNSNSKNDSRPCMGASGFLKSVDFTGFAVNVKTIAPKKYLYQFGHAIWLAYHNLIQCTQA